jgi:hypothetical protein
MRSMGRIVLAVGAMMCLTTALASAQATSTATETKKFTVLAVTGNDLVVSLPEGTRELNVPDSFRFTIDGQQMSVHQLKPGMSGTAVITTKTTMTPVTATEIKEGTVAMVSGNSITVRTNEGLKSFTQSEIDKRGIKIIREGKPAQLSQFRNGDKLSATIITSQPPRVVTEQEVQATLAKAPAPAAAPPARAPASSVGTGGAPAPAPAPARELPSTAGALPLSALVGLTSLAIGATLAIRRRRLAR